MSNDIVFGIFTEGVKCEYCGELVYYGQHFCSQWVIARMISLEREVGELKTALHNAGDYYVLAMSMTAKVKELEQENERLQNLETNLQRQVQNDYVKIKDLTQALEKIISRENIEPITVIAKNALNKLKVGE